MLSRLVEEFDLWLFDLINGGMATSILDVLFLGVTYVGSVSFWLIAVVLLWLSGRRREALIFTLGFVISSVLVAGLKWAFLRERPFELLTDARALAREEGPSFPSGHAERVILASTVIGGYIPKLRYLLWGLGVLVAFSRVYLGVHWPTDVIVGGALGWLVGAALRRFDLKVLEYLPVKVRQNGPPGR